MSTTPLSKSFATIHGKQMAYHESGDGGPGDDAVVFLHGNPTSSYLWRDVIPPVRDGADRAVRCIAPDLIGMGDSDKLDESGPDSYRFVEHRHYLDGLLDHLEVGDGVTFVVHDWGSALGFDWANRHRDRVAGLAYMEAIVRPLGWADWPQGARRFFEALRSPTGDEMILDKNLFVETILPASILRTLDADEMAEYRRPFAQAGEARRPTVTWPREIPIDGEPPDVVAIVQAYSEWLASSDIPKLFVNAEPGSILVGPQREFCRTWPNQTEITVAGNHFVQEDSADEIGRAITAWLSTIAGAR